MGYSFLEASAKAKIANLATNLGALTVFAPGGHIVWRVAVVMAVANVAGGYVGARTAVSRGNRFVRVVFIVVVGAFIVRIGGDLLGSGDVTLANVGEDLRLGEGLHPRSRHQGRSETARRTCCMNATSCTRRPTRSMRSTRSSPSATSFWRRLSSVTASPTR